MNRRRVVPRLYHKKSRLGCQRCKARRVKCDERKPECGNCSRHGVPCLYSADSASASETRQLSSPSHSGVSDKSTQSITDSPIPNSASPEQKTSGADGGDILDIPETKSERRFQLRLFHNHYCNLSQPFPSQQEANTTIWQRDIPQLAVEHDNLLYALLSFSATHLFRSAPNDTELAASRQRYLAVALREQRKAISEVTVENADAVYFAALLIYMTHFAMLHERSHEPYVAPTAWLNMGKGAGEMMQIALRTAKENENSRIMVLLRMKPALPNLSIAFEFHEDLRPPFSDLLEKHVQHLDQDTRRVYETTLMYLVGIQNDIDEGQSPLFLSRKVIGFLMLMPKEFDGFVARQEPLALVVLAYFFAIVAQVKGAPWWVGNSPTTEILATQKALPLEWQESMRWPVGIITE